MILSWGRNEQGGARRYVEERVRLLVGSPGASTTPIYSSGSSSTPIYSPGSSTPPRYSPGASTPQSYSPGTSRNAECSNCKHLLGKITVLEATVDMYMHPEQHTVNSAALFHEVYNNMGKLDLEYESAKPSKTKATKKISNDGLEVFLEASGFHKHDLQIWVQGNTMFIMGKAVTALGTKLIHEAVEFDAELLYDAHKVAAELSEGILKVTFPIGTKETMMAEPFSIKWIKF
ncbi:DNA-binding protein HEXBP [Tanacetum coccineum]